RRRDFARRPRQRPDSDVRNRPCREIMQTSASQHSSVFRFYVPPRKKKRPRTGRGRSSRCRTAYLPALPSWVDTFEKALFSLPPRVFTVAMIATEMPAAIRPYSIAVAPLSSRRKRFNTDMLLSQDDRQGPADAPRVMRGKPQRMGKEHPPDFREFL